MQSTLTMWLEDGDVSGVEIAAEATATVSDPGNR